MKTKAKCNHVCDGTDQTPDDELDFCSFCGAPGCPRCQTTTGRWERNPLYDEIGGEFFVWTELLLCEKCLVEDVIPF